MFKLADIKELIKLVDKSGIEEFEVENEGMRIYIRKPGSVSQVAPMALPQPARAEAAPAPAAYADAIPAASVPQSDVRSSEQTENLHTITAPMVGTFYEAPAPGAAPFVKVGDRVTEKTVVCILEAMKLMNEIEAEVKGEIVDVLVENGQLVEFGQPLFLVKLDS